MTPRQLNPVHLSPWTINPSTFQQMKNSLQRQFKPGQLTPLPFTPWKFNQSTFQPMKISHHRHFISWTFNPATFHPMDNYHPVQLNKWTLHSKDKSRQEIEPRYIYPQGNLTQYNSTNGHFTPQTNHAKKFNPITFNPLDK